MKKLCILVFWILTLLFSNIYWIAIKILNTKKYTSQVTLFPLYGNNCFTKNISKLNPMIMTLSLFNYGVSICIAWIEYASYVMSLIFKFKKLRTFRVLKMASWKNISTIAYLIQGYVNHSQHEYCIMLTVIMDYGILTTN